MAHLRQEQYGDGILSALGRIQALLESHSERLERIEKQLFGNGSTSFATRLALIEQRLAFTYEQQEQRFKEIVARSLAEIPRQQMESSKVQRWAAVAAWAGAILLLILQVVNIVFR